MTGWYLTSLIVSTEVPELFSICLVNSFQSCLPMTHAPWRMFQENNWDKSGVLTAAKWLNAMNSQGMFLVFDQKWRNPDITSPVLPAVLVELILWLCSSSTKWPWYHLWYWYTWKAGMCMRGPLALFSCGKNCSTVNCFFWWQSKTLATALCFKLCILTHVRWKPILCSYGSCYRRSPQKTENNAEDPDLHSLFSTENHAGDREQVSPAVAQRWSMEQILGEGMEQGWKVNSLV